MDHDDRDCPLWIDSKESLAIEEREFGPWLRAEATRLQRPQVAEASTRTKRVEGKSKGNEQQDINRNTDNNLTPSGVAHLNKDGETPPLPKKAPTVSDSVMIEVTPQEDRPEYFEEKLRVIDCAINVFNVLQGTAGIQATKGGTKLTQAFQTLGVGVGKRANTA